MMIRTKMNKQILRTLTLKMIIKMFKMTLATIKVLILSMVKN